MKDTKVRDKAPKAIPAPLVGKWGLMGSTSTQLEVNPDGSGSIDGSVWGKEPVVWSASESRLSVAVERGNGSARYSLSGGSELVLSEVQGLILVAGTYVAEQSEVKAEIVAW